MMQASHKVALMLACGLELSQSSLTKTQDTLAVLLNAVLSSQGLA